MDRFLGQQDLVSSPKILAFYIIRHRQVRVCEIRNAVLRGIVIQAPAEVHTKILG
jgi:hypothetical protein